MLKRNLRTHPPAIHLAVLFFILSGFFSSTEAKGKILIFPLPHQMELTSDYFSLDETVSIIVPRNSDEKDMQLAHFLVRELSDKYGLAIKIESAKKIPAGRRVVVMGNMDNPLIAQYCQEHDLNMTRDNPGKQGYVLQVSNDKIIIAGWDDPGAFYGLQSLRQLIADENGKGVQGINVRDWPLLPFRGIRLYVPGPENTPFFKRFLRDFMALYKFNKVIIEMNCMRLDRHPEVNAGWIEFANDMNYSRSDRPVGPRGESKNSSHHDAGDGFIIEKDDVRDLVDLAHQNYIEVIPEIPSLTHGYYILTRHHDLAEYQADVWPDTYCPSNPASYKLMFDVYDEYIDVIHPRLIQIGHDEWRVPWGVCPRCKGKNYYDLFAQDINKIYNYLTIKNVKVAMWGDHLLESVRGHGLRTGTTSTGIKYQKPGGLPPSVVEKSIPKDILVFNWFWKDEENDMELDKFGFTQVYGNLKPNIKDWNARIKKVNVIGGAPSSWAATTEFNIGKDLMMDFLGCANLLWSSHSLDQKELIPVVWDLLPSIRSYLSGKKIPSEDGNMIKPVDISSYFNLPKTSKVFNVNLSTLKTGEVHNRNKSFNLSHSEKCAIAVGTTGPETSPLPVEVKGISINEDVSSLIFLQACALPASNKKAYFNIPDFFDTADLLGWYEVVYEDGYKVTIPIQYGVNILEWNAGGTNSLDTMIGKTGASQNAYCYEGDPVLCTTDKNNPIHFFAYEWINPRFGKVIKEVNVYGSVHYQSTQKAGNPEYKPLPNNAIFLIGICKVEKRKPSSMKE